MPINLLPYIDSPSDLRRLISTASTDELVVAFLEKNSEGHNIVYLLAQITWRADVPEAYAEIRAMLGRKVSNEQFIAAYRSIPFIEWKKIDPAKALYNAAIYVKTDEELAGIVASCTQDEIDLVLGVSGSMRRTPFLKVLLEQGRDKSLNAVFNDASFNALNQALAVIYQGQEMFYYMSAELVRSFRMKLNYRWLCADKKATDSAIEPIYEVALYSEFFGEILASMSDDQFHAEMGKLDSFDCGLMIKAVKGKYSRQNLSAVLSRAQTRDIDREVEASPFVFFSLAADYFEVEHIVTLLQKMSDKVFKKHFFRSYNLFPMIWNRFLDRLYENPVVLYSKASFENLKLFLEYYHDKTPALYVAAVHNRNTFAEVLKEASAEDIKQAFAYPGDSFIQIILENHPADIVHYLFKKMDFRMRSDILLQEDNGVMILVHIAEKYPELLDELLPIVSLQVIAKILEIQGNDPREALLYSMQFSEDLRSVILSADSLLIMQGLKCKTPEGRNALHLAATKSREVYVALLDAISDNPTEFENALLTPDDSGCTAFRTAALHQTELPSFIKLLNLMSSNALNAAIKNVRVMSAIIFNQSKETFNVLVIIVDAKTLTEIISEVPALIRVIFLRYGNEGLDRLINQIKLAGIAIDESVINTIKESPLDQLLTFTASSSTPLAVAALGEGGIGDIELTVLRHVESRPST